MELDTLSTAQREEVLRLLHMIESMPNCRGAIGDDRQKRYKDGLLVFDGGALCRSTSGDYYAFESGARVDWPFGQITFSDRKALAVGNNVNRAIAILQDATPDNVVSVRLCPNCKHRAVVLKNGDCLACCGRIKRQAIDVDSSGCLVALEPLGSDDREEMLRLLQLIQAPPNVRNDPRPGEHVRRSVAQFFFDGGTWFDRITVNSTMIDNEEDEAKAAVRYYCFYNGCSAEMRYERIDIELRSGPKLAVGRNIESAVEVLSAENGAKVLGVGTCPECRADGALFLRDGYCLCCSRVVFETGSAMTLGPLRIEDREEILGLMHLIKSPPNVRYEPRPGDEKYGGYGGYNDAYFDGGAWCEMTNGRCYQFDSGAWVEFNDKHGNLEVTLANGVKILADQVIAKGIDNFSEPSPLDSARVGTCASCNRHVIVLGDNNCPSCRRSVFRRSKARPPACLPPVGGAKQVISAFWQSEVAKLGACLIVAIIIVIMLVFVYRIDVPTTSIDDKAIKPVDIEAVLQKANEAKLKKLLPSIVVEQSNSPEAPKEDASKE